MTAFVFVWRACNLTSFSPCLTGPVDHPFASYHQGPGFKSPRGYLCETGISPVSVVSLHLWPQRDSDHWLCRPSEGASLGSVPTMCKPAASSPFKWARRQCVIQLDLTQLLHPGFTLAAGPPSGFTTDRVGCWRGALWRACNLTSFSPCLTGCFSSWGTWVQIPRGVLMWNRDFSC
jgi:hypothetical protein